MPQASPVSAGPGGGVAVEFGHGPHRIVLLHAAGTSPHALDRLAKRLAADGWRTAAPFLVPAGQGADSTDPFATAIAHTGQLLQRDGTGNRILFGHSMGGLVALKAVAAGVEADMLVLYEPIVLSLLDADDPGDRVALAWDRTCIEEFRAEMAAGRPEAGVRRFVEAYGDTPWTIIPEPARAALVARASGLLAEAEATNAARLGAAEVGAVSVPTLLLTGSRSPAVLGRMATRLAALLPRLRLLTIEGAGHMGPVTYPGPVAEAVRGFLSGAGRRR